MNDATTRIDNSGQPESKPAKRKKTEEVPPPPKTPDRFRIVRSEPGALFIVEGRYKDTQAATSDLRRRLKTGDLEPGVVYAIIQITREDIKPKVTTKTTVEL